MKESHQTFIAIVIIVLIFGGIYYLLDRKDKQVRQCIQEGGSIVFSYTRTYCIN